MRVRSLTNPIDVHDSMIPWVVSAWELLLGNATELGQVVLVIDEEYGHQGPTTAEYSCEEHQVDLFTSQEAVSSFLGTTPRVPGVDVRR